jgi:hypothetical protein
MSEIDTSITGKKQHRFAFILELWHELRPYLLHILKDLIVSLLLRVGVWTLHLAGELMPIGGWVDDLLNNINGPAKS